MTNRNREQLEEGPPLKSFRLVLADLPNILGLFYLFAIGIGMLFTYQKYSQFGINIFEYADVFDFLIAPFADFTISVFTLGSLAVVYVVYLGDSWWKSAHSKSYSIANFGMDKRSWYKLYRYALYLVLLIFYLYKSSEYYGKISEKKVKAQSMLSIRFSDNETKKGVIIGKTKEIIFFMNDDSITAIPITSLVKEFEIK